MCLQIINSTVWSQTPSHFMYRLVYQSLDLFHQVLCLGDSSVWAGWQTGRSSVGSHQVTLCPRTKLMKKTMMSSSSGGLWSLFDSLLFILCEPLFYILFLLYVMLACYSRLHCSTFVLQCIAVSLRINLGSWIFTEVPTCFASHT